MNKMIQFPGVRSVSSRLVLVALASVASCLFSFGANATTAMPVTAPEIGISLRGVAQGTIEQGEPLRIAVRLEAPGDSANPLVLAPATGTWVDAIAVELVSAATGTVAARAEIAGQPASPHATLDRERIAGGLWQVRGESMAGVPPGEYIVRARLEISSGVGWKGSAVSDEMNLRIVATSTDPERRSQRLIARANEALLAGKPEAAAHLLDAELEKSPDDFPLLVLRAAIALRAGNPLAAQSCANRARLLLPPHPDHPSRELEELAGRIFATSLSSPPGTPDVKPPAWSWPPAAVLAMPENELMPPAKAGATSRINLPPAPAPSALTTASTLPRSASGAAAVPLIVRVPVQTALPAAGGSGNGVIVASDELSDAKIIADTAGQWATSAKAGSQYGNSGYAAMKSTGAPDVPIVGDSPSAWCPAGKNSGTDWLEVSFAKPVNATEVRVRQTNCPGSIVKIEAFEADGTAHLWWEGADTYKHSDLRETVWFAVRVPKTSYLVAKVKITLNLAAIPGWKQIDAVQLVGTTP